MLPDFKLTSLQPSQHSCKPAIHQHNIPAAHPTNKHAFWHAVKQPDMQASKHATLMDTFPDCLQASLPTGKLRLTWEQNPESEGLLAVRRIPQAVVEFQSCAKR